MLKRLRTVPPEVKRHDGKEFFLFASGVRVVHSSGQVESEIKEQMNNLLRYNSVAVTRVRDREKKKSKRESGVNKYRCRANYIDSTMKTKITV